MSGEVQFKFRWERKQWWQFWRIAERLEDPKPLQKEWASYLCGGAKARIQNGNFVKWSEATIEKYQNQGSTSVTAQGEVRKSYSKRLNQVLKRKNNGKGRDELRKLLSDTSQAAGYKFETKAVESLRKRLVRAKQIKAAGGKASIGKRKIEKHKMLGKLGRLATKLNGYKVIVEDKVPWSNIHNEGGVAGHGAIIPQRQYLAISDQARIELSEIALRWFMGRSTA